MYKCVKCDFISESKAGLSRHLKAIEKLTGEKLEIIKLQIFHPLLSNIEYLIELYLSGDENVYTIKNKFGVDISQLLLSKNIKRTSSQERDMPGYKQRLEEGCLKSLGVTNPSKSLKVKNKKALTNLEKYGVSTNLQTKESREKANAAIKLDLENVKDKRKKTMFKNHGYSNIAQFPEARLKNSISQKRRFELMSDDERRKATSPAREALILKMESSDHWKSVVEDRVFEIAKTTFSKNVYRHVFLWHFNYDMRIGNNLIEINGDFWHANPKMGYVRSDELKHGWFAGEVWDKDAVKKLKAESNKCKLIVMWESDINKMSDDEIKDFLKIEVIL